MRLAHSLAFAALLTGVTLSVSSFADCTYPKQAPSAPNGDSATEAEMISGKQAFNEYQTQMNAYLECLDKETDVRVAAAGDDAKQVNEIKKKTAQQHNAAIDELQARADQFNQQLRAYKAKHKS